MSKRFCETCRYARYATTGNTGVLYCMGQKGMPRTNPYDFCDSWKSAALTNADRIRSMSDEKMSEFFSELSWLACWLKTKREDCRGVENCTNCWLGWLQREVDE